MKTKAIQLLVNSVLPENIRDYNRSYDKKSIDSLMSAIADNYPERYGELVKAIADIGRNTSYISGETLTLNDFRPMFDREAIFKQMDEEIKIVKDTIKNKEDRKKAIEDIYGKYSTLLEDMTMEAGKKTHNNLFNVVTSGARGNKTQLKALTTTPALYTDAKGKIIPIFIRHSYGDGLNIAEYLGSTFGSRKSIVENKRSTADAGYIGKVLARNGAPYTITKLKDDSPDNVGLMVDPSEPEAYGRVLARDIMGLKKGTVIDRDIQSFLRKHKVKKILVHSPIASVSGEGISAEAYGTNFNKRLPSIGFAAGITSGNAIGEPLSQGALNSKHTCLWSNTLVKMADGSIKMIKDIEVGDMVLGSDKQGNIKPVKVLKKFDQGEQPCYKWKFKNNKEVVCTEEHKFLVDKDNVKKLKELS